ncbi:nuclear transport factor 2 family protein [Streptomyces xiaopingdaonensis]|uniref:nuclear transport factor 2 family protein n=1 Tax=Streptomyces xiaopingdaonensis TaxID=1565415 RepID=UPI000309621A|nr:nuclear transport factor 2 family protein [Streptomyces xiaopingdaonensis]
MSLAPADRLDLADLVARYAAYVDDRRVEEAAALFTRDATLALPAPPARLAPEVTRTGRAEIVSALREAAAFPLTRHTVQGELFNAQSSSDAGARAAGRVLCTAHHLRRRTSGALTDLVWQLQYTDNYLREEEGWRITRREVRIDWIETRSPRLWRAEEDEGPADVEGSATENGGTP